MTKNNNSYNQALAEIETIISEIEDNKADMDQLSIRVERALELIKFCKSKLKDTETDIEKLLDNLTD